ncbi:MAG: competence/damage-inducible protein A [candidate division WOR-3 bacterium]
MLKSYIIVIGDEILSGRTLDTNSHYLAKRLADLGITPNSIITIGDDKQLIEQTIAATLEKADIVFVSGGLGPTSDDKTIVSVANVLKRKLIIDEMLLNKIEKQIKAQDKSAPEFVTKQALVPQGAIILDNPVGQAPGIILKHNNKILILLPGVPIELEKIFETSVVPFLHDTYELKPDWTIILRTANILEVEIVERISEALKKYREIKVAYLPAITGVDVKITGIKDKKTYYTLKQELLTRLKPYVYADTQETIEEIIGRLCKKKQVTVSVAESCTGGLIADRITNVPGSSEYFIGGVVAYSNAIKKLICNVKSETLKRFGAVSKETVIEMAIGIKDKFSTDIGISVSGIAGPTGATDKKPVGLVYIGIATKKSRSYEEHKFLGNRRMIKEKAAMAALDLLRRNLEQL